MKKQFSALLLVLLLLPSLSSAALAVDVPFSDVPENAWYAGAANWCRENGIIGSTSGNTFSPDRIMTRAMLAVVLYRAAESPEAAAPRFTDVPAWCADAVGWASERGFISGYGNGLFGAGDPVTREQFAAILWRYAGRPEAQAEAFADESSIAIYARPAVAWARAESVVGGVGNNRFNPKGHVTRAQTAVILYRYLSKDTPTNTEQPGKPTKQEETNQMYIQVGDTVLTATLADNSSAEALKDLLEKGPVTINMSDYGNFEKVGPLGTTLPRNDEQITTTAGDIILYQGNQITIYYAQNSWSFTRLGKINDVTAQRLKEVLGDGDVTVSFSLEEA